MLEAFHWLKVAAVSMAILHAPWFTNLLPSFNMQWKILFSTRTKKLGQIIITYLARNSNRNRRAIHSHFVIHIHLRIFSTPSAVNPHTLQRPTTHRAAARYSNRHVWGEKNASHTEHGHTWCREQYQVALTQYSKALCDIASVGHTWPPFSS